MLLGISPELIFLFLFFCFIWEKDDVQKQKMDLRIWERNMWTPHSGWLPSHLNPIPPPRIRFSEPSGPRVGALVLCLGPSFADDLGGLCRAPGPGLLRLRADHCWGGPLRCRRPGAGHGLGRPSNGKVSRETWKVLIPPVDQPCNSGFPALPPA